MPQLDENGRPITSNDDVERSCTSKTRYGSEADANRVAADCWKLRRTWLRVYACTFCGGFHLTKTAAMPPMNVNWRPPAKAERDRRKDQQRRRRRGSRRRGRQ
jgi:hypothetical protein